MIELNLILQPLETFHIGTGRVDTGLIGIQTTIKDPKKRPFIPGTSLKGAVRFNYQRLYPLYRKIYPGSEAYDENKLFGTSNQSSLVYFSDALLDPNLDDALFIQTRVHIDAIKRTSEQGGLFHFEKVFPNLHFQTKILLKKTNSDTFKLLLYSLKELKHSGIGHNRTLTKVVQIESQNEAFKDIIKSTFTASKIKGGKFL